MSVDPILIGGLAWAGGMVAGHAKTGYGWVQRRLTFSLTLYGEHYSAFMWKATPLLEDSALVMGQGEMTNLPRAESEEEVATPPRMAPGDRIVRIGNMKLVLNIDRDKMMSSYIDSVRCSTWKKNRTELLRFAEEALKEYRLNSSGGLRVYSVSGSWWEHAVTRPYRSMASIISADGVPDKILGAIDKWNSEEKEKLDSGENHHLGILLSGEPGTGKTSLAIALASHLKRTLYVLTPANISTVKDLIVRVPSNCVLLIEECEEIFADRASLEETSERARIASILSYFDGPTSKLGVIRIYTTNHPDKLDPGFLREGRVDYHFVMRDRLAKDQQPKEQSK